ncbi:MAG: lysostaphin resistance A-like protein [Candidatus Hermodarchaeota archaeon]
MEKQFIKGNTNVEKPILKRGSTLFILLAVMAVTQLVFLVLSLALFIISIFGQIEISDEGSTFLTLVFNITIQTTGVLFIWIFYRRRNFLHQPSTPTSSYGWPLEIGQLFSIDVLATTMIGLLLTTIYIIIFGSIPDVTSPYGEFLGSISLMILFFVAAVITAPIYEELLFRQYSLSGLEAEKVTPGVALLLSSVFFGLIHTTTDLISGSLYFATVHLINTSTSGLILGFLLLKRRRIIYPIILHALINGYALFSTYVTTYAEGLEEMNGNLILAMLGLLMLVVMGLGCLSLIIRIWQNRQSILEWFENLPNNLNNLPYNFLTISSLAMLGGAVVLVVGIPVLISFIFATPELRLIYGIIRGTYWLGILIISVLFIRFVAQE